MLTTSSRCIDEPERLLSIYRGAWLSLCDSRILRGLAKLDGRALPLVTGSDLVAALLSTLNSADPTRAPRLLIVGPPPATESALRAVLPGLPFDLMPAPGGLAHDAELRRAVARACMDRAWDILLLCVGCPAQELIAQELGKLGRKSGIALCAGASIDFLTGSSVRAPLWLQKLSLEWAYRLLREPRPSMAPLPCRVAQDISHLHGNAITARSLGDFLQPSLWMNIRSP